MNDSWRPWSFAIKSFLFLMVIWCLTTVVEMQFRVGSLESWVQMHDAGIK